MAKPSFDTLDYSANTSDTFLSLFELLNSVIGELQTDIVTASVSGDSTTGNANLIGTFTANTISTPEITSVGSITFSANANFNSPVKLSNLSSTGSTISISSNTTFTSKIIVDYDVKTPLEIQSTHSGGGMIQYSSSPQTWRVGMLNDTETSSNCFVISSNTSDTSANQTQFWISKVGVDPTVNIQNNLEVGKNLTVGSRVAGPSFSGTYFNSTVYFNGLVYSNGVSHILREGSKIDFLDGLYSTSMSILLGSGDRPYIEVNKPTLRLANSSGSNTINFNVDSGNINIDGTLSESSDSRLKENVKKMKPEDVRKIIGGIRGVRYNWISDKEKKPQIGVIAQEVRRVMPEAVVKDEDTGMLSVNYTKLVPVLLESIKELQKTVDKLSEKVNKLSQGMDE